ILRRVEKIHSLILFISRRNFPKTYSIITGFYYFSREFLKKIIPSKLDNAEEENRVINIG
uniref:hypothetical protein n=1 Tax=Serratia marcescens TaxID=615 RepID=UPI001966D0DD